jgi:gamma-glutamylcyclotransferase (GGCT)/AIG2-like uncharacterized protein YtfP
MDIITNSLVAVYGSLRFGLGNHRVLGNSVRQDDGIIANTFKMFSLSYFPALVKSNDPVDIVVEVYEVATDSTARSLDSLEGYPSFYNRELVKLKDGRDCWVYFIEESEPHWPEVSGDWKKYIEGEE